MRSRALIIAFGNHARMSQVLKLSQALESMGYEVVRLGDTQGNRPGVAEPALRARDSESATRWSLKGLREAAKRILFSSAPGLWLRDRVRDRRRVDTLLDRNKRVAAEGLDTAPAIVIASQWDTLPAGKEIADTLGIPLIYDSRDLADAWATSDYLARRFVSLENASISRADLVLAPSWSSAAEIAERHNTVTPQVLFNSWDVHVETPSAPHAPVRLLFQGHFAENRCLDELIRAMEHLRRTCTLTLQGWGAIEGSLRQLVQALDLQDSVQFLAPVESSGTALAAGEHDVGIINYRPTTKNLVYTIPNKLFDYMAGGLAVVCSDFPDLRRIVETADCGVLFEPTGPAAIADAVSLLIDDRQRLAECKQNSLAAWHQYSWATQREDLKDSIERVRLKYGR